MRIGPIAAALAIAALAHGPQALAASEEEPAFVRVQHILIGFKRSIPNQAIERSKKEAAVLAQQLFERAEAGEDFDALVKEYSDERYPGILGVTNRDAPGRADATPRQKLVERFGDVAFRLEVGEVGLAAHHAGMCPYGWHIIKRLE